MSQLNQVKTIYDNMSIEKIWKLHTELPFYKVRPTLTADQILGQEKEKQFEIRKLALNFDTPSTNITGIPNGRMIKGIGGATGALYKCWYIKLKESDTEEDKSRVNNDLFYSPCGMMIGAFLDYFQGGYNKSQDKRHKFWKEANCREEQKMLFESRIKKIMPELRNEKSLLSKLEALGDHLPNHRDIQGDNDNFRIQVVKLPNDMIADMEMIFEEKTTDVVSEIVNRPYPYWKVHDLVTLATLCKQTTALGKDNKKAPVMTFRRGVYCLVENNLDNSKQPHIELNKDGNVYVVSKNLVEPLCNTKNHITLFIRARNGDAKWNIEVWLKKVLNVSVDLRVLNELDQKKYMTTSTYKSWIQKIIRTGALTWKIFDQIYDAKIVLIYSIYKILYGSAQYLPSLHRSVQGPENVCKRLGVIAFEDADPFVVQDKLVRLFGGALLSQTMPDWFPDNDFIEDIFTIAISLFESNLAVIYRTDCAFPYAYKKADDFLKSTHPFKLCACLLRVIRSFEGDMRMVEHIACSKIIFDSNTKEWEKIAYSKPFERPKCLPFYHLFDQHVDGSLMLLLNEKGSKHKPFGNLCSKWFKEVTGMNWRRHDMSNFEERPFVKQVREAQQTYLKLFDWTPFSFPREKLKKFEFEFVLPDDILAGAIGPFSIGKVVRGRLVPLNARGTGIRMVATLNPFDIHSFVCCPELKQRGQEYNKIKQVFDEDVQSQCQEAAGKMLEYPNLRLMSIPEKNLPLDLYGTHVRKNDENKFTICEKGKEWDEIKKWKVSYDMVENYIEEIDDIFSKQKRRVLQRALVYLNHYNSFFKMAKVGRDGDSGINSYIPVSRYDGIVFHMFLHLSKYIPCALIPSHNKPFQFTVENPYMLKWLKNHMEQYLNKHYVRSTNAFTGVYEDIEKRELYDYQIASIKRMQQEKEDGRSRHFMRLPVGTGKTLTTLTYATGILEDIEYIFYTMPRSAFVSVITEMISMGFQVHIHCKYQPTKSKKDEEKDLLNICSGIWEEKPHLRPKLFHLPKKNSKCHSFEKGVIHIIEHDGLKNYESQILDLMPTSLFVIDEVHKCLYNSKRSGSALTLSKLAMYVIAFTGTPILNKNGMMLLIRWLECNVRFKVTEKNCQVACNAMISFEPQLPCEIIEEVDRFDMVELTKYMEYEQQNDFLKMVSTAYDATRNRIISKTIEERNKPISGSNSQRRQKIFVVVDGKRQQCNMALELRKQLPNDKIVVIGIGDAPQILTNANIDVKYSIDLTDKKCLETREVTDYDIVISRVKFNAGFNLSTVTVMISGVFFSNEADRTQIRGRLTRMSQKNPSVKYITCIPNNTFLIQCHGNYERSKFMNQCMQKKQISKKDMDKLRDNNKKRKRE